MVRPNGLRVRTVLRAFAIVTTFAFAVLPGAAHALIVPGRGIAGVRIGYSEARVRGVLGKPIKVVPPGWAFGAPLDGRVGFDHARRVNDVWTASPRQRTARGVGPGASLRRVKRSYPKAKCTGSGKRARVCTLVSHRRGHTIQTAFLFRGRLRRVDIYVVIPPSGTRVPK